AEVAGRPGDAEAAFREFVARLPKSPWAARARGHIEALSAGGRAARPARVPWRVIASGTVLASGPVPAPLIDAAWRDRPQILDGCLDLAAAAAAAGPPAARAT